MASKAKVLRQADVKAKDVVKAGALAKAAFALDAASKSWKEGDGTAVDLNQAARALLRELDPAFAAKT